MLSTETVYAVATGGLPAAIAIVRLSGPGCRFAIETMIGKMPEPRKAERTRFNDPGDGTAIDEGIVLWFPGPKSFTGEDMVEFHLHGGVAVVGRVLAVLGHLDGFRMAEPGEFTRRAFEHGKMDLTMVEGVADLIEAETEAQRRQALLELEGETGAVYADWRARIVKLRAALEAAFDFAEEEDGIDVAEQALEGDIRRLLGEIGAELDRGRIGERIRDGFRIALMGPPNVGKSSLLNRLARSDVAIVTEEAGTTRDVLSVRMNLGGYRVDVMDTAGIRAPENRIEAEGISRALATGAGADLVLWMNGWDMAEEAPPEEAGPNVWTVINKVDLASAKESGRRYSGENLHMISAKTGQGLDRLTENIGRFVGETMGSDSSPVITRERHRLALENCRDNLKAALGLGRAEGWELKAEELRRASDALGRITGKIDVEDILDEIFREFCIGK